MGILSDTMITGTFTPTILDDTLSASEGQAYTTQYGGYYKIGTLVFFRVNIKPSSLGTLTTTQQARIGGLPFTAENVPNSGSSVAFGYGDALNLAAADPVTGTIVPGTNYITLRKWSATTGTGNLLLSEVSADGQLQGVGWYITT